MATLEINATHDISDIKLDTYLTSIKSAFDGLFADLVQYQKESNYSKLSGNINDMGKGYQVYISIDKDGEQYLSIRKRKD